MRKALTLSLMTTVLLLALVGSGYCTQHIWTENFNKFEPIQDTDGYATESNYTRWYECRNSSLPANVTFTSSVADGILEIDAQTLIASSTSHSLTYYRECHIESSLTWEIKFSGNTVNAFSISFIRIAGGAWQYYVCRIDIAFHDQMYFYYINTTGLQDGGEVGSHVLSADEWYIAKISWDASPNHMHALFYQDGNSTAIGNFTVLNNLYDFTDVTGVAIDVGAQLTVDFFRVYIDYIRVGSMGSSMMSPAIIASIMTFAMLAVCVGTLKKMGKW